MTVISKTEMRAKIKTKTMIATVDIGKQAHSGYCRCPDGTDMKPFDFKNTRQGFDTFWETVDDFRRRNGLQDIVFGYESTGGYAEPLVHFLSKKPIYLVQVNPVHTKRFKEVTDNSPNKTDHKDPRVIADLLEIGRFLQVIIPRGAAAELRRLIHGRERCIKRRTMLYNQLQGLVGLLFPEFLEIMKGVHGKAAQAVLDRWPIPQDLQRARLKTVTTMLRKTSRGRIGSQRAQELLSAAGNTVGLEEGRHSLAMEIRAMLKTIAMENELITALETEAGIHLRQIPYSRSMLSIRGIGKITVAGLIGEVGDFRNFNTISQITKLAGLNLFERSSGKFTGQRRISKRGRALMRKLLYFAALNAVRKDGIMHHHYHRHLEKGMLKKKALIAVAKKLLRIMFALVRDHGVYQDTYTRTPSTIQEAA